MNAPGRMLTEFVDLKAQYAALRESIDARIRKVLEHGQFILGPEVAELEGRLAQFAGTKYCITCASGTEALLIALMALDIKPGDEVVTTPFTFAATAEMIVLLGAKPVFVDIEADTCNIDARKIGAAVTGRTRAIMPVSLYGQPADMDEINAIESKRIFIIDDNIVGAGMKYIRRAKELFDRLQGSGKEWGAQTCLNIVEHPDVLKLARESGCRGLLIGFESIDADSLEHMHKPVNLRPNTKNFSEAIQKIHDHGLAVIGCFIFGADTQSKDVFRRTVDFALANNIDAIQMTLETPLPGTAFYRQMVAEDRLLLTDYPDDWRHYNIVEPVFQMKNWTPREAYESLLSAYSEVSSLKSSLKRATWTLLNTKSLFSTAIAFSWNYHAYKAIRETPTPLAVREGMVLKKVRKRVPVAVRAA